MKRKLLAWFCAGLTALSLTACASVSEEKLLQNGETWDAAFTEALLADAADPDTLEEEYVGREIIAGTNSGLWVYEITEEGMVIMPGPASNGNVALSGVFSVTGLAQIDLNDQISIAGVIAGIEAMEGGGVAVVLSPVFLVENFGTDDLGILEQSNPSGE